MMKIWVGILTLAIILLGIGYGNLYCSEMQFDGNSAGVIISAMGVLVTVLVGWQIWQTIDIKDKIDKINNIEQSALKMQDDISAFKIYMEAENLMLRAFVNSHNNKKEESFDYIFDALYKYAEISYKDYAQATTIKVIADTIEFITEIPHIKQEYINRCGKLVGSFQNITLKNAIVALQNCLQKKKEGKITDLEIKKISQQYFDLYRQLDLDCNAKNQ